MICGAGPGSIREIRLTDVTWHHSRSEVRVVPSGRAPREATPGGRPLTAPTIRTRKILRERKAEPSVSRTAAKRATSRTTSALYFTMRLTPTQRLYHHRPYGSSGLKTLTCTPRVAL